jgi:hypothetical protein
MRWRTSKTVAIPDAMNAWVATIERGDTREMPHTPCPLVQPDPLRVPTPMTSPATASTAWQASTRISSGRANAA